MAEGEQSIGRGTIDETDRIEREILRNMPSPILDPWAWLSEGMGHGLLGRLRKKMPEIPGPIANSTEPEAGIIPHPEPTPPPPGPRDPQDIQP